MNMQQDKELLRESPIHIFNEHLMNNHWTKNWEKNLISGQVKYTIHCEIRYINIQSQLIREKGHNHSHVQSVKTSENYHGILL